MLTAAAIRILSDKGLNASDIADVAEANERQQSAAAVRQKRYRDNKRCVTRDVTPPPNDIYSNPPVSDLTSSEVKQKARRSRPDVFPCPDGVDPVDWDALKANRKAKRAANSPGAHRGIAQKLRKWADDGWPPGPIVANAAERGWTTVFETDEMKVASNGSNRQTYNGTGGKVDGFIGAIREARASREARGGADDDGAMPRLSGMG